MSLRKLILKNIITIYDDDDDDEHCRNIAIVCFHIVWLKETLK